MFDPFLIPLWIELDAINILDHWGDGKKDVVDLTKHCSKASLIQACARQRDTFDWCTDDKDLISMEWVEEFLTNSVTLILYSVFIRNLISSLTMNREGSLI